MRRFLVVIEDPHSVIDHPDALEAYLKGLLEGPVTDLVVARVQRGGILADKVMEELPPVRHKLMGRARG